MELKILAGFKLIKMLGLENVDVNATPGTDARNNALETIHKYEILDAIEDCRMTALEKKLGCEKAYYYQDEDSGVCTIVWDTSKGKAKRQIADGTDVCFTDVRLRRLPWADGYNDMSEIPYKVVQEHGWENKEATCL
jgi:hypothetical protein